MFKLSTCLFIISCFGILNFSNEKSEAITQKDHSTRLVEDTVPLNERYIPRLNDLFIKDYYSNYYFMNLNENYGFNVKGSCTQLALAQLFSYIDTYWDDSFVPESYEKIANLSENKFDYKTSSPGISSEDASLVCGLSTYDYYRNVVNNHYNKYFHLLLIKIGYEQFGYYNFNDEDNPCTLYDGQINKIADYYLFNFLGKSKSDVLIEYANGTYNYNRKFVIQNVKNGTPVLVRGKIQGGGHAMIAYDYDSKKDTIYYHAGWGSDSRHYSEDRLKMVEYWDALTIMPITKHKHTNNYIKNF